MRPHSPLGRARCTASLWGTGLADLGPYDAWLGQSARWRRRRCARRHVAVHRERRGRAPDSGQCRESGGGVPCFPLRTWGCCKTSSVQRALVWLTRYCRAAKQETPRSLLHCDAARLGRAFRPLARATAPADHCCCSNRARDAELCLRAHQETIAFATVCLGVCVDTWLSLLVWHDHASALIWHPQLFPAATAASQAP